MVSRGVGILYGLRNAKPIEEVVGFGVETLSSDVIVKLIDIAFEGAPRPRTNEQKYAFSFALERVPFIYAPPADRDRIIKRLSDSISNVDKYHLISILQASEEGRLELGDIFENVVSRTTDRLEKYELQILH